jgi:serine/threonine protein kinase
VIDIKTNARAQRVMSLPLQGRLQNGRTVAVKKLLDWNMDEKKFHQEVGCLMMARHKNIVRFLGYCADTQGKMWNHEGKLVMAEARQRLLCFEFMPNGSLRRYITGMFLSILFILEHPQIPLYRMILHYTFSCREASTNCVNVPFVFSFY